MSAACVAVRRLQASLRPCWLGMSTAPSRAAATKTDTNPKYWSDNGLQCFLRRDERGVGRSWAASELRLKSFEDLQKLWVLCVREQNFLHTRWFHMTIQRQPTPRDKIKKVKQTMARIKQVLTERALEEPTPAARQAAMAKINAN